MLLDSQKNQIEQFGKGKINPRYKKNNIDIEN